MASNTMDFIVRFRDEASAGLRRLQATVNQINGGMNGAARSTREFSRESESLSRSTRNASNSNRETSESLRSIGESSRRARSEIRELTGETGNYRDANGRLRNANGAFIRDTERSTRGVKGFGMSLKGLGPMAAAAGSALAAVGMAGFAKDVMSVGIEFDSAISEVSALSGAQGDALQSIRDKAKEIGSTTSLSASEAASAFKYMSLAGWDAEQMLGAVDGVAQLAIASGEDLGAVADIVTN